MLKRNAKKYLVFILGLCLLSYFPGNRQRGKLIQLVYSWARDVDEPADGDAPLPPGYKSSVDFVDDQIAFIRNPVNPKNKIERKAKKAIEQADEMGHDIRKGLACILLSIRFDAVRRGKFIRFPKAVLDGNYDLLDVFGCSNPALQLYGEDAEFLTPIVGLLATATRIYYTLRDFETDDIPKGLINIPLEDFEKFGINPSNLTIHCPEVQDWFRDQARLGLALIDQYKKEMVGVRLRLITRLTLFVAFEMPAKKNLTKIFTEPPWE